MPRLSVDLDLVFPDHGVPRDQALAGIREGVTSVSVQIVALAFWGKPDRDWIGAAAP
jgi:hypothetical protein